MLALAALAAAGVIVSDDALMATTQIDDFEGKRLVSSNVSTRPFFKRAPVTHLRMSEPLVDSTGFPSKPGHVVGRWRLDHPPGCSWRGQNRLRMRTT
jgi:hypothetical protein